MTLAMRATESPPQQPRVCTTVSGPSHGSLRHSRRWSRAPITVATKAATGDLPWWPQGPPAAAMGTYCSSHGGLRSGHRDLCNGHGGPTAAVTGDLPQRPRGPIQWPRGPPAAATGDLPQWPRGTYHGSSQQRTSHSGHRDYHSGHGGPTTAATGKR